MTTASPNPKIISTVPELQSFLSTITSSNKIYLDLEGTILSRNGTISIISILVLPQKIVNLIDVLVLGKEAFTTATTRNNKTLKSIFEDPTIAKYLWDVRNDADALWALYQVGLSGVIDIQLLENASRPDDRTHLRGLDVCVQRDAKLPYSQADSWKQVKQQMKNLMSSNIFTTRPMAAKTILYCSNDVVHLPALQDYYLGRIKSDWLVKVKEESARRVIEAHSAGYQPNSPSKKFGPWGSGGQKKMISLDEMIEMMADQMADDYASGLFRPYYNDDRFDDNDGGDMVGEAPECMEDCWTK